MEQNTIVFKDETFRSKDPLGAAAITNMLEPLRKFIKADKIVFKRYKGQDSIDIIIGDEIVSIYTEGEILVAAKEEK